MKWWQKYRKSKRKVVCPRCGKKMTNTKNNIFECTNPKCSMISGKMGLYGFYKIKLATDMR